MITLILVGIVLLFINFTIGCIYIAAILFTLTIGLIIREEKKKENTESLRPKRVKKVKRVKEVNKSNKLLTYFMELYEKDRKKFWVYIVCIIISVITVAFCFEVIAGSIIKMS